MMEVLGIPKLLPTRLGMQQALLSGAAQASSSWMLGDPDTEAPPPLAQV